MMAPAAAVLMATLHVLMDRFDGRKKDRGATAVEYGFLVSLIAMAIVATLILLGPEVNALYVSVLNWLLVI